MASILVIEDNNEIQEILRTLLAEEHEVIQAFFWHRRYHALDKGGIDLVLLDIMLPWEKWRPSLASYSTNELVTPSSCSLLWVIKSSSANIY